MSDAIRFEGARARIAQEFTKVGTEKRAGKSEGASFGSLLENLVKETDSMQKEASTATDSLIKGESDNVHEVLLAMNKADLSFKMMLEVRNKLLDAYHEVMRMQV